MRTTPMLASILVLVACGDDGGGGGGGDDANGEIDAPGSQIDAPNNPQIDAPMMGEKQIGSRCTPDAMNPQGDCPTGMVCLNLDGGSHPWCSKRCTEMGDTCSMGYTGPGKAQCYLTVSGPAGPSMQVCGVICDDLTPMDSICPSTQCNGMCPAMLMCTANLTDMNMMTVAKGCQ